MATWQKHIGQEVNSESVISKTEWRKNLFNVKNLLKKRGISLLDTNSDNFKPTTHAGIKERPRSFAAGGPARTTDKRTVYVRYFPHIIVFLLVKFANFQNSSKFFGKMTVTFFFSRYKMVAKLLVGCIL